MNDENPLWYDHAEAEARPGPILRLLAFLFSGVADAVALVWWIVWLPDRLWLGASARFGRLMDKAGLARR